MHPKILDDPSLQELTFLLFAALDLVTMASFSGSLKNERLVTLLPHADHGPAASTATHPIRGVYSRRYTMPCSDPSSRINNLVDHMDIHPF